MAVAPNLGDAIYWLGKLEMELDERVPDMEKWDNFYMGKHPLPFLTRTHEAKMNNEFAEMLDQSKANFMRLVVDAVEERMRIEGYRASARASATTDSRVWEIWQANNMDSESQAGMLEALVKGVSYLSVWKPEGRKGDPVLALEDPTQCIVGYEPGTNFRKRAAALKIWRDDVTGRSRANVYLPDGIYKFVAGEENEKQPEMVVGATGPQDDFGITDSAGSVRFDLTSAAPTAGRWQYLENDFVTNPIGVVPIVPLRNRPRLRLEGETEISDVTHIQTQINGFLFLLALAGYFGAHKQRWAIGLTIMNDKQGKPVEPFRTAIDTLWVNENPEGKFGEFAQTDMTGYLKSIEQKVQHIAVITRTPRHYLLPEGQEPSGDSIRSAESGLIHKVKRKQRPFGEGFEEALRLAQLFDGKKDVSVDAEIVWTDPSSQSDAEITDAAIKKWQLGLITHAQALEDCGYSQTQIAKMMDELGEVKPPAPAPDPAPDPDPTLEVVANGNG